MVNLIGMASAIIVGVGITIAFFLYAHVPKDLFSVIAYIMAIILGLYLGAKSSKKDSDEELIP